jgi:purine-binding chemotaxis protein CheW
MSAAVEATAETEKSASSEEGLATQQYLTFLMNEEEYGVDILAVQEIRGWERATMVPNSPSHMKGVLNLRGTIVPIIDLRDRFEMPSIDYSDITVVVILKIDTDKGDRTMGIIVDAISDVYDVPIDKVRSTGVADNRNSRFIKGLVTVDKNMVILLELKKLLTIDD